MTKKLTVAEKLDAVGIDAVCTRIIDGETLTAIAADLTVSRPDLLRWLDDPSRSAHAREARIKSAAAWDEKATEELRQAADPFELARAKELAHHYRWRASKISPQYGEKITVDIPTVSIKDFTGRSELA